MVHLKAPVLLSYVKWTMKWAKGLTNTMASCCTPLKTHFVLFMASVLPTELSVGLCCVIYLSCQCNGACTRPAFCRSRIRLRSWSFSHVPALPLPVVSLILSAAQERCLYIEIGSTTCLCSYILFCVVSFYPFRENRLPKMSGFPSMLSTSQFYLHNYHWFYPINKACFWWAQLM
jgi:hypothetical protein